MKFRLIIFDFDGTLADTLPFMLTIADQLADKHNLNRVDKASVPQLREQHAIKLMKMFNIPMWKLPLLARDAQALMNLNLDQIKMFTGIGEVVRSLKMQGASLALVTSNALENVKQVLGEEIASLFTYIECGVSLFGKSEKLLKVLWESQVPANETLSIGDEIRDIEAARRVGIPCAAVSWGYASRNILSEQHPDHMVDSVEGILEIAAIGTPLV